MWTQVHLLYLQALNAVCRWGPSSTSLHRQDQEMGFQAGRKDKRRRWVSRQSPEACLPPVMQGRPGGSFGSSQRGGVYWSLWLRKCLNIQKSLAYYHNWKILWACENHGCDLITPANHTGPESCGELQWRTALNQQVHSPAARLACLIDICCKGEPKITHSHPCTVLCLF